MPETRRRLLAAVAVVCACVCVAAGSSSVVRAEDVDAVVTARRLFLRRGPGTEFPPYTTIGEGSTVTVKELRGKWARVSTLSGQSGYVHADFLRFLDKVPPPASAEETAPQAAEAEEPDDAEKTALEEARQRNAELESQVSELRQRLEEMEQQVVPAAGADVAPAEGRPDEAAELERLATAVEALQRSVGPAEPVQRSTAIDPDPLAATDSPVSGTAILFGLIGAVIGWIGSSYARRSERTRRSRIRL